MDHPRSPVQDAGLRCGPFRRLGVRRVARHGERGRLPRRWGRRPRSWMPIRLSVAAHGAARVTAGSPVAPTGPWLPGTQDVRCCRESLLNVVVPVVSEAFPVADPVAAVGNRAGDWRDSLMLDPGPADRRNRHRLTPSRAGRTAPRVGFSRLSQPQRKAHCAQGQVRQREMAVGGLAEDAVRPG